MLRLTTLCENTTDNIDVIAEFGWSVLVETDKVAILFDTGLDISVCRNADALGIDLRRIDKIVLSHGHPDHTGGLRQVLQRIDKKIDIIAHPDIWAIRHKHNPDGETYNGIPFQREALESLGAVFRLTAKPVHIGGDIMTTGQIPATTDFEDIASTLPRDTEWFIRSENSIRNDEILDDQALIIKTKRGLVIVLGCGHRGIINTINHAQKLTGISKIDTIIGGAHLLFAGKERVIKTIAALRDLDIRQIGLCHCTGLPASAIMVQEFGERWIYNNSGNVVEIQ
jgi:7,8-dihydropterin-6-yl-methyl-4-(beta-D-ribofuranosyl)aminobenzene 5'-phosphate synthase